MVFTQRHGEHRATEDASQLIHPCAPVLPVPLCETDVVSSGLKGRGGTVRDHRCAAPSALVVARRFSQRSYHPTMRS